jgi:uncharacterized coiled-coil DUF342 family protein
MKSQCDAVVDAVKSVLADNFSNPAVLNSEQRKQVVDIVAKGLYDGTVDFSDKAREKYDTYEKVRGYTSGMVSNHLRKDKRLNGEVKYEIKNPGSRAGQGDAILKNLKALRSQLTDKDHIEAVDEKIKEREAEIAKSKAKTVTIDVDAIPDELKYLLDNIKAS